MNPPPLSRTKPDSGPSRAPPVAPAGISSPATPSHPRQAASTTSRPRRQLALDDSGTPRTSRLRQEVFTEGSQDAGDAMEVDEES